MQTTGSRIKGIYGSWLIVASLLLPRLLAADPAVPLTECREQSIDQTGFEECLMLLVEQSENALVEMENSWLELIPGFSSQAELSNETAGDVDLQPVQTLEPSDNRQLIAIVSEQAMLDAEPLASTRVINIDASPEPADSDLNGELSGGDLEHRLEKFARLSVVFRQYRDQRCGWETQWLSEDRATTYNAACMVAINRQQLLQLRQQLAEKLAAEEAGESYRGYFLKTAVGSSFQSCDRRQDWWVTGAPDVLSAMQRRYDNIAAENLEMVYVELRGTAVGAMDSGPGVDYVGAIEVNRFSLMRPILDHDCGVLPAPINAVDNAESTNPVAEVDVLEPDNIDEPVVPEVTVDELGAAGFLYGYFSSWLSACAVDKLSVCQAQTQAEYASEGEWMLIADRSSRSNWRVRLVPTTENHQISGGLNVAIDGIENVPVDISGTEMEIGRGVTLASGRKAKTILARLRAGQTLDVEWVRPDQMSAKVTFSLVGITRSLQYFNQAEK